MSDVKALFGGDDSPIDEPIVETPPAAPQEAETAPETPVALETPAEPPAPAVAPPVVPDGYVPMGAVHEERRKRQLLEDELRQFRAQSQPQPAYPDQFADPDGYTAAIEARMQQVAVSTKLDLSEAINRDRHGDEVVSAAQQWALEQIGRNPAMQQTFIGQQDPYGYVVKEYKRHKAMESLGNADLTEIEQFKAWKAAQAQMQAIPAAPPPIVASPPPKSLASATNAGGGNLPKPNPNAEKLAKLF